MLDVHALCYVTIHDEGDDRYGSGRLVFGERRDGKRVFVTRSHWVGNIVGANDQCEAIARSLDAQTTKVGVFERASVVRRGARWRSVFRRCLSQARPHRRDKGGPSECRIRQTSHAKRDLSAALTNADPLAPTSCSPTRIYRENSKTSRPAIRVKYFMQFLHVPRTFDRRAFGCRAEKGRCEPFDVSAARADPLMTGGVSRFLC